MAFRALALGIVRWGNSFHWPSVKRKTTFLELSRRPLEVKKKQYVFSPATFENNWTVSSESFVAPFPPLSFTFFLPHTLNLTTLISLSFPFHSSPVKIKDGDCTEETSSSRPPEKLQRKPQLTKLLASLTYLRSTHYSLKINVNIAFSMQFLLELDYIYLMYTIRGILWGNLYFLN